MPSWLPGDDYMTNFRVGDPFVKIDDGYARLPGAGYEAIHPELQGLDPEDYPDIHKLRILSDVAPYSREYNTFRQKLSADAKYDTGLQIELDKIIDRVRQVKESSIRMDERRFTEPVEEIAGTVEEATPAGLKLKEYPGRIFRYSSVGTSAADMSAAILGENNQVFSSCRTTKTLTRTRGREGGHRFELRLGCSVHPATHGCLFPEREQRSNFIRTARFTPHIAVAISVWKEVGIRKSPSSIGTYAGISAFWGCKFAL